MCESNSTTSHKDTQGRRWFLSVKYSTSTSLQSRSHTPHRVRNRAFLACHSRPARFRGVFAKPNSSEYRETSADRGPERRENRPMENRDSLQSFIVSRRTLPQHHERRSIRRAARHEKQYRSRTPLPVWSVALNFASNILRCERHAPFGATPYIGRRAVNLEWF